MADCVGQVPKMASMEHPAFFEAVVPKGVLPGQRILVFRPDGEQVQAFVPNDAAPGDMIHVPWSAEPSSPTPVVMGVPIAGGQSEFLEDHDLENGIAAAREEQAAGFGWAMYGLGWCACCFLGPFGPIFWFCTWFAHYLRPKEERKNFPREHAIANLSCCTGLLVLLVHAIVFVVVFSMHRHISVACGDLYDSPDCRGTPAYGLELGTTMEFYCPPVCARASCYGTYVWGGKGGLYAHGSSICGAGLQAGVIADNVGGHVLVEIARGAPVYFGVQGNGISSQTVEGPLQGFRVLPVAGTSASNGTVFEPAGAAEGNATAATTPAASTGATTSIEATTAAPSTSATPSIEATTAAPPTSTTTSAVATTASKTQS